METLRLVLLFLHILGFAALLGGLLVQMRSAEKVVNGAMRDGAGTAFLAGLLLVGVLEADDVDVNHTKIGGEVRRRAGDPDPGDGEHAQAADRRRALLRAASRSPLVNVGVAVFWSPVHQ